MAIDHYPALPSGRRRAEFDVLLPAEQALLISCAAGDDCLIGNSLPLQPTESNRVRASFVRFLALGGDETVAVHERGVRLRGAWIIGDLDFSFATIAVPLILSFCHLPRLSLLQSRLPMLRLSGSWLVTDLMADRASIAGNIFLNSGFRATGEVRLLGATITGNLECSGGLFTPNSGDALSCDAVIIGGNVFLNDNFRATGTVRFPGASISGNLECIGGIFTPTSADAINCNAARIGGNVLLSRGFRATGGIRLLGINIAGNLSCKGGLFTPESGAALSCDRATISGNLYLIGGFRATGSVRLVGAKINGVFSCRGGLFTPKIGKALNCNKATIGGGLHLDRGFHAFGDVDLSGARINRFVDAENCWPTKGAQVLDGIQIGQLGGLAPTSAAARIKWLQLQPEKHLYADFRPQPWEEMIRLLRAMGHDDDAREVAMAKQDAKRAAGDFPGMRGWFHVLWGVFAGYGYKPYRLVSFMVGCWLYCAILYAGVDYYNVFAPTNPVIHADPEISKTCSVGPDAGSSGWTRCEWMPDAYTTFQPFLYSLDVILPLVDLQQEGDWAPAVTINSKPFDRGVVTRWVMWIEILFGWMSSLMLVAILTNLIKKD
jgi:hypothetical protein